MPSEPKTQVTIVPVKNEGDLFQALAIREVVFIEEQHVPEGIERDEEDAKAFHLLAIQGGHAVGTGRLVMLDKAPAGETGTWVRIGRMAVLRSHRKMGTGALLLHALEQEARQRGVRGIVLHAQVESSGFYRRQGYQERGDVFEEANMPHVAMVKYL